MENSSKFVLVLALFLCVFVAGLDGRDIKDKHKEEKPQPSKYQPQTVGPFAPRGGNGAGVLPGIGGFPGFGSFPAAGLPSFSFPGSLPGGLPIGFPFGSVPIPGGGQTTQP